ncbi:hypothetical protein CUR178_08197 [Leishmania enriettii]|uniref:ABC transporter domain-containing protein n=1 Tax=Leishmania enriettii TaxID=5663 RepID=A0A836HN59_LEIEN|nr:hypothetical protein CUR178_08197 [Leishmania enriettii]
MRSSREADPRESEATEERFAMGQAPALQARRASAAVAAAASSAAGQQSFTRAPLAPKENADVATGPAEPLVSERHSSIASLDVPQPSRRVHTVSPSALRRSEGGVGHYGGLLPAEAASVSRGNMPSATGGACGGGDARSSRQQSPGYPPVVRFGSPSPDCQYAEPSAGQQQGRDRRHQAPPRVECELQYRRIEMGPTSWSGNLFSGESTASPMSSGDFAAHRGRRTSFQCTKGDGWVRPVEAYDSPSSIRSVLLNRDQQKTKCDNNEDAATEAIATITRDSLPEGAAGNCVLVSPPSAAAALIPGRQLPPAARAAKPPPQQPQTPPTAAAVISASRAERSHGASSASSPMLKLDAALSPDSRRSALPDASGDSLGSHAMHEMSRLSSSCDIGGAYGSTEAAATNSGATTCSRSSSAVESDVGDINSAGGDIAPIPGHGHDGSASDPFGHGGTAGYRDAKTTSSLPTSCPRSAVDGGGDLGHLAAGGVGQPQKSSGTWLDQLGATIWRDVLERRRRWVSVMLEVVIPLVCTTCAVVLWAAFGVATSPRYSPLSSVGGRGFNFKPGRYLSAVCYNETWFGEPNFIDGLLPCRNLSASSRPVTCNSVGEEALPVKGLCYTQDGRALMAFVDGVRDGLSQVMPLDDIIAYKWLAKKLSQGPSARSLLVGVGLASNSRFSAIQSSGKLYFAPRKHVPDDMLEYLSANAKLLQYVYNDTFDTVEAAHRVIKSGERGPTWALVNIRQLDENGFDVSIEMESMALPRLEVIIDKAYPGGPSFDRSDVYYASGYPSLMNELMRYYFLSLSAAGAARAEVDVIQSLARRRAQRQQQQHRTVSADSVDVPRTTRELLDAARTVWKPVGEAIESFAGAAELGESLAPWTLQNASRILTTSAALRAKANITMYVGGLPWVPFERSRVLTSANTVLGFVVVLAFLYPVSQLTRRLVLEKERRVREVTLIMGLDSVHLWCSWLLHSAALMFTISFFMTLLMCATFLSKSDAFSVLLVVFMFALTCVPLSGLLAAFFNTSRTAALMTPLIYFAMSLILFAMRSARPSAYLGLSIFSPTCFALIMQNVLARESGDGFAVPASLDSSDNPSTAALLGFLTLDLFVYLIGALYLDAVLPRSAGVPKQPLFFVQNPIRCCRCKRREAVRRASPQDMQTPSAPMRGGRDAEAKAHGASCGWCCAGRGTADNTDDEDLCNGEDARDPNGVYEAETFAPEQLSVRIRGLRKFFRRGGRRFAAVRNFCWQVPDAGISVLLGHNGAGKSTVMHMMTGMLHPDGGDCYIGGYSVRFELARPP